MTNQINWPNITDQQLLSELDNRLESKQINLEILIRTLQEKRVSLNYSLFCQIPFDNKEELDPHQQINHESTNL
jgi:hypothetical protein